MKTFGFIAILILAPLFPGHLFAQQCDVDSGFRGNRFEVDRFSRKHLLKPIGKLSDLPAEVRRKLENHLTEKLGKRFLKHLQFEGGEYLDLVALRTESPKEYEINSKIGSYDFLFRFSKPSKGLKYFYSRIALFEDGSVADDIALPNVSLDSAKAALIPCKDASMIAGKNGFPLKYQNIEFGYSFSADAFVWIVSDRRAIEPDKTGGVADLVLMGKGTFRRIEIEAHTGKVLRIYKETIVV
jgi:hypothetical protein